MGSIFEHLSQEDMHLTKEYINIHCTPLVNREMQMAPTVKQHYRSDSIKCLQGWETTGILTHAGGNVKQDKLCGKIRTASPKAISPLSKWP